MAKSAVKLMKYCRTENGWHRYEAVIGGNGRVRPGWVWVDGKQQEFPEGPYVIRWWQGSKPIYENAGTDAAEALNIRNQKEADLKAAKASENAGRPDLAAELRGADTRKTLAQYKEAFLLRKQSSTGEDAGSLYRITLELFLDVTKRRYAEELTNDDIWRWWNALGKEVSAHTQGQLSQRTKANRFGALMTFLRFCVESDANLNLDKLVPKKDRRQLKKYTKTEPEAYTQDEIDALIAASKPQYKLLWDFLLKTGFRMQEAMYLEWTDLDFVHKTSTVRNKPHLGFQPKGRKERSVPLPNGLGDKLKAWKEQHPGTRFVFGTRSDLPNNKWLHKLKRIAAKAGLNCGACEACLQKNECERFFLHKFRATYATRLLQNGVDIHTVQRLLGHAEITTTMRYLSAAKGQTVQDKVNAAFAAA